MAIATELLYNAVDPHREIRTTDKVGPLWLRPIAPLDDDDTRAIESDPEFYARVLRRIGAPGWTVTADEALASLPRP
jgi:hypothetical protein